MMSYAFEHPQFWQQIDAPAVLYCTGLLPQWLLPKLLCNYHDKHSIDSRLVQFVECNIGSNKNQEICEQLLNIYGIFVNLYCRDVIRDARFIRIDVNWITYRSFSDPKSIFAIVSHGRFVVFSTISMIFWFLLQNTMTNYNPHKKWYSRRKLSQDLKCKIICFLAKYTHAKWPVIKQTNNQIKPGTYVPFMFELDDKCIIIKSY